MSGLWCDDFKCRGATKDKAIRGGEELERGQERRTKREM
jgi:hypothetical protein